MPLLNTLDVQIGKNIARDFTGSQKAVSFVYGDTALIMVKYSELDYTTNAFVAKDFTADGGNPQALRVTVRADRDASSTLYTFQDVYNNGDVPAFEDATLGQITYLVSFSDAGIGTALGVNPSITAWIEFSYLDGTGYPSTLLTKQITIYNEVDDGAPGTPPPTSPTYLTAAEIAALYITRDDVMTWGVLSATTTTPPALTSSEDKYIIPTGATGAWAAQVGKIAVDNGSWTFYTASEGWFASIVDTASTAQYINGYWIPAGTLQITQVAHGLTLDEVVYNNAGTWTKAKADAVGTLGVAMVSSVLDVDTFTIRAMGEYSSPAHGLTVGGYYYVSAATAGAITATAPSGLTEYKQPIVYVLDSDNLLVFPWRPEQALARNLDTLVTATVTAATYNWLDTDELVPFDSTAQSQIGNLPTPSSVYAGFTTTAKKIDNTAFTLTIKSATGTIDGVAGTTGHVISVQNDSRTFVCDGTNWLIK